MVLKKTSARCSVLVECPFCYEDLEGRPAAPHLKKCKKAKEEMGIEP